jgi:hypothetical protein
MRHWGLIVARHRASRLALLAAPVLAVCPLHIAAQTLPDAPSALLGDTLATPESDTQPDLQSGRPAALSWHGSDPLGPQQNQKPLPPCSDVQQTLPLHPKGTGIQSPGTYPAGTPCQGENAIQPIVSTAHPALSPRQKAFLAVRDIEDPFNLITIVGYSGIVVAINSHTAYGPGLKGWGRLTGYSFVEDAQGETFGTFLIPTIAHQDPRYYRMPGKPVGRRILHAIAHTYVSRHDDGSPMPNYATLLTYPISAELSNLYVPGIAVDGKSTAERIALGIGTNPVGDIVAEFLPDIAKRIHIRVVFVQQILQQVANGPPNSGP